MKVSPAAAAQPDWARTASNTLLAVLPVVFALLMLRSAVMAHVFALDYDHALWMGGAHVLAGITPYVGPHAAQVARGEAFIYPAVAALALAPLSLLPHLAADVIFTLLCAGGVVATLRLCQVRDWRLYGLAFLWPAVISGWQTANITLILVAGMAAVWRYRDRPVIVGATAAAVISLKLFLWPVAVWLLATRRYRATAWAAGFGVAVNVAAWSVVGFGQIPRYLRLMRAVTASEVHRGYTLLALSGARTSAYILTAALASLLLAAMVAAGRRGQDRRAFVLGTAACLMVTPLLWLHYFALLLIPLALARPRLSFIWWVPVLMWFSPSHPASWQVVAVLALASAVLLASLRRAESVTGLVPARQAKPKAEADDGPVLDRQVLAEHLSRA